jgi:hypothetical protein
MKLETKKNPLTEKEREALAKEIYNFLLENDLWSDVCIYFNGICWSTNDRKCEHFRYGGEPFVFEDDPRRCFEYVRDPNILTMSFEGPFYEVLNGDYRGDYELENKFRKILEKYGLYYEQGDAWNLSCYPI